MHRTKEISAGVYLRDLPPGSVLDVETKSRHYRIEYVGGAEVRISGHPDLCPTPMLAELQGSLGTDGMVQGFLGRGMRLEFRQLGNQLSITTSTIQNIHQC